jgi:hypothetical protein
VEVRVAVDAQYTIELNGPLIVLKGMDKARVQLALPPAVKFLQLEFNDLRGSNGIIVEIADLIVLTTPEKSATARRHGRR